MLDTTGSMGPLIEGAKRKIWSIATAIVDANPDAEIRMGLVAYRDIGDEYVTKTFDLTTDIQDLYANLLELQGARRRRLARERQRGAATSASPSCRGRKAPEICRIMFLVGDAPPHMDYAQDTKYPEVLPHGAPSAASSSTRCRPAARATPSGCGARSPSCGNGRYIPIPQDGGQLVIIETPWDIEIIELQGRINGTVIPYGPRAQRSSVEQKTRQVAAAPAPVAAEMAGYLSKRSAPRHGDADHRRAAISSPTSPPGGRSSTA